MTAGSRQPRKRKANKEDQEQRALFTWADAARIPAGDDIPPAARVGHFLFAIPNGGKRSRIEAAIMTALGTRPGYPDVGLDLARLGYHGLRIEMKKRRGDFRSANEARRAVSPAQFQRIQTLRHTGYAAGVCYGFAEAHVVICEYLGIQPHRVLFLEAVASSGLSELAYFAEWAREL